MTNPNNAVAPTKGKYVVLAIGGFCILWGLRTGFLAAGLLVTEPEWIRKGLDLIQLGGSILAILAAVDFMRLRRWARSALEIVIWLWTISSALIMGLTGLALMGTTDMVHLAGVTAATGFALIFAGIPACIGAVLLWGLRSRVVRDMMRL